MLSERWPPLGFMFRSHALPPKFCSRFLVLNAVTSITCTGELPPRRVIVYREKGELWRAIAYLKWTLNGRKDFRQEEREYKNEFNTSA